MATFNELLYRLAQSLSPDEDSTLNEEVIEAAVEAEVPNAENYNAAAIGLAAKILGIEAPSGVALNALVADYAEGAEGVVEAVRLTEENSMRETESGLIRRTE